MTTFAIVDLETTGNAATKGDRVIEIGVVVMKDGNISEEFSSLVYPEKEIPAFITSLTGITNDEVLDAPLFSEIIDEVYPLFHNAYVVAHNIEFDLGFLNAEFERNGYQPLHNPILDTVELSRIMLPTSPSFKLGQLAEILNMGHDRPHRALSDAQVTSELLNHLLNRLGHLPEQTLTHLLKVVAKLKSDLRPFIEQNIERKRYDPNQAESFNHWHGIPVKKVVRSKEGEEANLPAFCEWVHQVYDEEDGLRQFLQNYEKRSGQKEMSQWVFDAFSNRKHAIIEAGAGTGKSLAYLLGALYYSVSEKERVMVTTHTTSLQKQLLEHEIPFLENLFQRPIQAVLYKGRSHYISIVHFSYELENSYNDNYDVALTKAILLVWLTETVTGDVDEIQLPSSGQQFWHKVSSEQSRKTVEFNLGEDSFYHWAKKEAENADIVITNHALFCMDLISHERRLPEYDRVIVDEAHHLEAAASRHFGLRLNYMELQRQLSQFTELFQTRIYNTIQLEGRFFKQIDKSRIAVDQAKEELNNLSRFVFQKVKRHQRKGHTKSDVGRMQYLLEPNDPQFDFSTVIEMCNRFLSCLHKLKRGMEEMVNQIQISLQLNEDDSLQILFTRLENQIQLCQLIYEQLKDYFRINHEGQVKWIEIEGEGASNSVYLYSEPLHVDNLLNERLFSQKSSVVLTSATLTTNASFDYMKQTLGLVGDYDLLEISIPSPYRFEEQVQVMIPDDFPSIKSKPEEYINATSEAIYSIAQVTKGRMLVLFTSYDMLRKTYTLLREFIDPEEFMIFAQGVSSGSRDRLKKNFQAFENSILLGTSSFWEGVDIPGDDLSCLMIVRLPFQPPDQPVQSMRNQFMDQEGRNSFMEHSLPNAIIRFKQGFGRLIRSGTDRGVVFICDHRLMEARYGKYFLSSIPKVPVNYRPTGELLKQMQRWL